jgi:hypothetical protein
MHLDIKKDKRFNPIAGEEAGYSSESGNEREDYENSHYDNRMVPADKKVRADLEWKIKSIKTNVLPKKFTDMRQNALQKAQTEFEVWDHPNIPFWRQSTMEHRNGTILCEVQRMGPSGIRKTAQRAESA